jgi:nitrogen regulatory protein P-II 1
MNTREVKAFIHRNRIADVVDALYQAGFHNLTVIDVQGLLKALDSKEQRYSVEIGQKVITEVKLELVCEDENRTAEAITLIREYGRTGQPHAGWIYVTGLLESIEII